MTFCKKCHAYIWSGNDGCPCKPYAITCEDGEDYIVYEKDEHSAAKKYAEQSNVEGDYYLMDGSVKIKVNGNLYRISAEPDIYYCADPITEDK